jgi:hypothetical protein
MMTSPAANTRWPLRCEVSSLLLDTPFAHKP